MKEMLARVHDDYEAWARDEAGIVAPKVRVSSAAAVGSPTSSPSSERTHPTPDSRISIGGGSGDDDGALENTAAAAEDPGEQPLRGLYATETIHPGERILFVPSSSLLGADSLRELGSRLLLLIRLGAGRKPGGGAPGGRSDNPAGAEEAASSAASGENRGGVGSRKIGARLGERIVVASIELLRRILLSSDDGGSDDGDDRDHDDCGGGAFDGGPGGELVRGAARDVGYEWRDDDAVAVYLACCRSLLQEDDEGASQGPRGSEGVVLSSEDDDALPPITEAVLVAEVAGCEGPGDSARRDGSAPDGDSIKSRSAGRSFPSLLPHVAALPSSFPTSPLYYSDRETSRIEGTNCAGYAGRMLRQFGADHARLARVLEAFDDSQVHGRLLPATFWRDDGNNNRDRCHLDGESEGGGSRRHVPIVRLHRLVTFDLYKWALCNVYSRSSDFAVVRSPPLESSAGGPVLLRRRVIAPLFDMMNHDFASDVTHSLDWEDHGGGGGGGGGLSVFNGPSRAIEAGEEVRLSYGSFSNEKLLLIYGFVAERNPHDAVAVYAPLGPDDPLGPAKRRLLRGRCGVEDPNEPHLLRRSAGGAGSSPEVPSVLPRSLLSVLRLIGVRSAEELVSAATQESGDDGEDREDGEGNDEPPGGIGMISVENERSALLALQQALYSMSRQIALNLISDESLRQGAPEPPAGSPGTSAGSAPWAARANESNAKILCRSEYQILQSALAELHSRLEALDGAGIDQQ
jgi:hypothetical protein